jgi:hypothetical protein
MLPDPHAAARDAVLDTVLRGPGQSDPALRLAASENAALPLDLVALIGKVHHEAYRVTDDDVARTQERYGDDALFELIVSAALGASGSRLVAGLAALEDA